MFIEFEAILRPSGTISTDLKHFCADTSHLSGFKSDGAVKGVRGGVRMGNNESVRTPQHLARRGVRTF